MTVSTLRERHGAAVVLLLLGGLAATVPVVLADEPAATRASVDTEHFPAYPFLDGHVRFWTRVFGEWGLGQVAVHDMDRPDLIYQVVDLPGPIEERYTEEQSELIEGLNERWRERLRRLGERVAARDPLDEADKELALRVATTLGSQGLSQAADRVRTQRGLRERFRRGVEIAARYDATFRALFRAEGLPEDLAYLPHVESSFQTAARSSAGAVGVWQFTRGTGRRYLRLGAAIDERLDPVAAARGAARYLREAHERLGSWPLALTAYNHGINGMARAVQRHGSGYERVFHDYDGRSFGFASKNFYAEFLAAREVARQPEKFFGGGLAPEPELDLEAAVLDRAASPLAIARAHGVPLEQLAPLNPAWTRRAVEVGLPIPAGSTVWLPPGTPSASLRGQPGASGHYVVRSGDTLSTIAAAFGVELGVLRAWNGIEPHGSLIRVGQRLRVAPPADRAHVVRRGETLSTIAETHGIRVRDLRELNGIAPHQSLIRIGQRLTLPAAASPSERVHVVRSGETLLHIALEYGVRLADLLSLNRLTEHATIHPGQRLLIPSLRG